MQTATVRQLESLGVKGNLLRSCIHKLQRHAIQSLHEIWKARQERIRKKQVNPSQNRAPVYRPEAGSRFRFQGKLCPVPRFQRCQTCQFLVPALGHPLANMSHAGSSKFLTKCMITL